LVNEIEFKIIKALVCSLFLALLPAKSQNALTPGSGLHSDSLRYLKRTSYLSDNPKLSRMDLLVDSALRSFMQSPQNCGISIGISENGKNYFYNYGEIKRESKLLPDKNTIYEIGALTATFCGILLAKAVTENKISLEEDIRKYLPGKYADLTYYQRPVRIKHLANHTSGLPHLPDDLTSQDNFDPANPYKNYTKQQIFMCLQRFRPAREPGQVCEYSSLGIAVLGIILEKVYNTSFETLVREKICVPNNMFNTCITLTSMQWNYFSPGYNVDGEPVPAWDLGAFAAAGGLRSTSQDLLNYLNYNLNEKDPSVGLSHNITFSGKEKVGLAWFVKKTKQGNTLLWQSGGTLGSGGFTGAVKEQNCSVVILANNGRNVDYIGIAILNYLQK
jgi:D-alanyl-D-alanine-carboxypeptidase/D-alanyl-D-alanine-endopeptidase